MELGEVKWLAQTNMVFSGGADIWIEDSLIWNPCFYTNVVLVKSREWREEMPEPELFSAFWKVERNWGQVIGDFESDEKGWSVSVFLILRVNLGEEMSALKLTPNKGDSRGCLPGMELRMTQPEDMNPRRRMVSDLAAHEQEACRSQCTGHFLQSWLCGPEGDWFSKTVGNREAAQPLPESVCCICNYHRT